jgi:hypothetical protein
VRRNKKEREREGKKTPTDTQLNNKQQELIRSTNEVRERKKTTTTGLLCLHKQ